VSKCNNCHQELQAISPAQSEYVSGKTLRIPLTDICLTIYHDKPTIQYDCPGCIRDRQDDRMRDVFDAGREKGWLEAEEQS
jgi:hypothetical protein